MKRLRLAVLTAATLLSCTLVAIATHKHGTSGTTISPLPPPGPPTIHIYTAHAPDCEITEPVVHGPVGGIVIFKPDTDAWIVFTRAHVVKDVPDSTHGNKTKISPSGTALQIIATPAAGTYDYTQYKIEGCHDPGPPIVPVPIAKPMSKHKGRGQNQFRSTPEDRSDQPRQKRLTSDPNEIIVP